MTQILSPTLDHLAAAWSPVAGSRRSHGRYSNSDPDFSPDGKSLLYASDRSGTADLWLHDLGTGKNSRLSGLPGAQTAPRYSPDGKQVAYQDQDGIAWVLDLASGEVRQLTPTLFQPGRVSWS